MAYYLGIDGGNSKTHALIVSNVGDPVGFGSSQGSDFQEVGLKAACRAWKQAISMALDGAGLKMGDLSLGCFCLAGADLPEDYAILQKAVNDLTYPLRTVVKNDSIAALRAGLTKTSYGVAVVVGAGFNAAGLGKDGTEITLPGLGYISGDYGGGRWIARQVIREVMRAWDGRGLPTSMRKPVLDAMGAQDELDLIRVMREKDANGRLLNLVPILFEASYNGDEVAQGLLTMLGTEVGITANMLISRLSLEQEEVPVILSTGVFRGKGPLFLDVIAETIRRAAPRARILIPDFIPVVGATLEAWLSDACFIPPEVINHLYQQLKEFYPELVRNDLQNAD